MISLWLSLRNLFGWKLWFYFSWSGFLNIRAGQKWQSHRDRDYSTTSLESLEYVSIFCWMDQSLSLRADQRWLSRKDLGHDTTKTWWWWWQDETEDWTHVLSVLFWVTPCQTAWSWSQSSQFQELGIPDSELLTNSLKRLWTISRPFSESIKTWHYIICHCMPICPFIFWPIIISRFQNGLVGTSRSFIFSPGLL